MTPAQLFQIGFVTVAGVITAAAMAYSPLLGTPTAELATFLAALWGPGWLITSAVLGAQRKKRGFGADLLAQAIWIGSVACVCMTLAGLGALKTHSCSPSPGVWTTAVLALPVWCFNVTVGLWIGHLAGRTTRAVLLSVLGLTCYGLWQIVLLCDWPSFGVASHLSAVIATDLLQGFILSDTVIAFRCSTLLFALSLGGLGIWCFPKERARGFLTLTKPSAGILALAIPLYLFAWLVQAHSLQHIVPSRQRILQEYDHTLRAGQVVLHHPTTIAQSRATAFLQEATLWLELLQKRLGIVLRQELHIWLHPDRNAQRRHTGAHNVDFAAMGHMHITATTVPHPTLGHELVHLLVGQLTRTVWGIPGRWGILPNLGLHEGLAVAVTHELVAEDGMTLWQQAAAIHQAGFSAPPLKQLFSCVPWEFWSHHSGRAYTFAGAAVWLLLRHAHAQGGSPAVHQAVGKLMRYGTLQAAFENPKAYATFQYEWQLLLRDTPLPKHAVARLGQQFSGESILHAACDPQKLQTRRAITHQAQEGDWNAVQHAMTQNDSSLPNTTFWLRLANIAQRRNESHVELQYLQKTLAHATQTKRQEAKITEALGDALWRSGNAQAAIASWSLIHSPVLKRYEQRRIVIKQALAQSSHGPHASPAAVQSLHLLTHVGHRTLDARYASLAQSLKENAQERLSAQTLQKRQRFHGRRQRHAQNVLTDEGLSKQRDKIPRYLLARYLLRQDFAEEALWHLHHVTQTTEKLPPLVALESQRLLAVAAAKAHRLPLAIQVYKHLWQQATTAADRSAFALELRRLRMLVEQQEIVKRKP